LLGKARVQSFFHAGNWLRAVGVGPALPEQRAMETTQLYELADRVTAVRSEAEKRRLLRELTRPSRPTVVSFLNANSLMIARRDREFSTILRHASLLLRDGVGASLLLRSLGREAALNMNGTDFIPEITRIFAGRTVALLGAAPSVVARAAEEVAKTGCRVVLASDGFHRWSYYADRLRDVRADLIVLGMGTPKQEKVAARLAGALPYNAVIVNGGAILDRWAGRVARALRAEWLYRLCQEPRRLWRRYLLDGLRFAVWVAALRFSAGAAGPRRTQARRA
jgi:exopolysaccharide biosynthesis WecB/TagA/CpsF family protein